MAAPLWFPIAFRTAHDRIGVAPLGSLRSGSEELRISAACDCGDVQRRGLFCAGPDSSAADCGGALLCLGKTGESFRVSLPVSGHVNHHSFVDLSASRCSSLPIASVS